MMNIKMKIYHILLKGFIICCAGCCIGIGVGIILYANVGSDTVTVFQDGLHVLLRITYGQASRIYNFVLIIIALLIAKSYFGSGTIISAFITGYVIDFTFDVLTALNLHLDFWLLLIVFLIGQTIYSIGLSILIRCNLGMNALECILYRLIDYIRIDYKWVRLVADSFLTVFGYLLGGIVGIGTILSIVCTGVMVDTFSKIGRKCD